jgi:hypothetical protein
MKRWLASGDFATIRQEFLYEVVHSGAGAAATSKIGAAEDCLAEATGE